MANATSKKGATAKTAPAAGFNADERKQRRMDTPVTIGGRIFGIRPQDWDVTNGLQAMFRRKDALEAERDRRRAAIDDVYDKAEKSGEDPDQDKLDGLYAEEREARLETDRAAFAIIAFLLVEDGEPLIPDIETLDDDKSSGHDRAVEAIEHIGKSLDVHDLSPLTAYLMTGGRLGNDSPTSDTPSTSSS